MRKPVPLSRKVLEQTVFYTLLFTLLAHGYRFLNMSFSGDAALIAQDGEIAYQTSIGRFMQPLLWMVRGTITAPMTIGIFATAALIGASLLLVSMLGVTSRSSILLICGILATNETLSVSYATYLPWVDVYMIAFFFSMCGVYVSVRWRYGWLLSPLFYFISLGLYQSYLQTAVVTVILLLMMRLFGGERLVAIWFDGIKSCIALLAGLGLYYIGTKYAPQLIGIHALDDYNSAVNATILFVDEIPKLLKQTYLYPFEFFARAADSSFVPPLLTLLLLALSLVPFFYYLRKLTIGGILTACFLLAVLPFGANFAAFISKGFIHSLMVYSFFFLYIMIIVLHDHASQSVLFRRNQLLSMIRPVASLLLGFMLMLNILTANQLYLRRDLEFYSTTSAATRILKHADAVEGYIPGETPVCVLGYLPSSKIGFVRPGFESLSNLQGMRYTYAASYETATPWYFQMILGYPVNFVSAEDQAKYQGSEINASMPSYPDKDCYQLIDGILFIKLN